MLILNNRKDKEFVGYKWIPHADFSVSGSVIYPRGTAVDFMGTVMKDKTFVEKMFSEGHKRENVTSILVTTAQFPFTVDDVVIDDMNVRYIVRTLRYEDTVEQMRYLKTAFTSKRWFLGLECLG